MAQLIRIDRDARRTHTVTQAAQHLRIDPSRFAAAESVEGVEADLHPLAESDGFDIVDRYSILQRQSRNIRAQWETAIWRQVPKINCHAAADLGPHHRPRVAERRAVKFAVTHQHDFADQVHDLLTLLARKPRQARW